MKIMYSIWRYYFRCTLLSMLYFAIRSWFGTIYQTFFPCERDKINIFWCICYVMKLIGGGGGTTTLHAASTLFVACMDRNGIDTSQVGRQDVTPSSSAKPIPQKTHILLVHYGHIDSLPKKTSNGHGDMGSSFDPYEPICFSRAPAVCAVQCGQTVAQLKQYLAKTRIGPDLLQPSLQSKLKFGILDKVRILQVKLKWAITCGPISLAAPIIREMACFHGLIIVSLCSRSSHIKACIPWCIILANRLWFQCMLFCRLIEFNAWFPTTWPSSKMNKEHHCNVLRSYIHFSVQTLPLVVRRVALRSADNNFQQAKLRNVSHLRLHLVDSQKMGVQKINPSQ